MVSKKNTDWIELIRQRAKSRILYTYHATIQMNLEERLITTQEVKEVIFKGELIETRLNDQRGEIFLLSSKTKLNRYVHVVCSPKNQFLAIVTVYIPNPDEWENNFTKRVKNLQ